MALTTEEQTFVESIMGEAPPSIGCYVYHVANTRNPRDARNYFNAITIENNVGFTTTYKKYGDKEAKLYAIVFTPSEDEAPALSGDTDNFISGLGD